MKNTHFMHYRNYNHGIADCHGGATVAIQPSINEGYVVAAIARCSNKDLFVKKVGRAIAVERLKSFLDGNTAAIRFVVEVEVPSGIEVKDAVNGALESEMSGYGLT